MYSIKNTLLLLCAVLFLLSCQNQDTPEESSTSSYQRIVSLSGGITETLFALGQGDKIVGIDVTSTYPADKVAAIPNFGHVRSLNVEGVLGAKPDLILVQDTDAEMPAIQQLKQAGVEMLTVGGDYTLESPIRTAKAIATKLNIPDQLSALQQKIESDIAKLEQLKQQQTRRPKVLFIYARGTGNMMVAGRNTPAKAMIELAGGENAVNDFDDFKALSAEGLIQAQPDVLLLFETGVQSLGGTEAILAMPGIAQTPAGRNKSVIAMDGLYLLGFTPRAGEAALDLAQQLQKIASEYPLTQLDTQ